jgi:hypothetical protein
MGRSIIRAVPCRTNCRALTIHQRIAEFAARLFGDGHEPADHIGLP